MKLLLQGLLFSTLCLSVTIASNPIQPPMVPSTPISSPLVTVEPGAPIKAPTNATPFELGEAARVLDFNN